MAVNLSISTEEARALLLCIGFVRSNIVLDAATCQFRFVSGKPLSMTIREGIRVDFLSDYIKDKTVEAINSRPFNPFVHVF